MSIISHQIAKPFGVYLDYESFIPKLRALAIGRNHMYDTNGLTTRYKVNRPLNEEEIAQHLNQTSTKSANPDHHNRIIAMNSTYLECCDKFYLQKGSSTGYALIILFVLVAFLSIITIATVNEFLNNPSSDIELIYLTIFAYFLLIPLVVVILWGISRECFNYTYYPIRFNRKTRKVHVFRRDSSVMTEDWDKLFFTPGPKTFMETYDLRVHRLADDKNTVLETFALPYTALDISELLTFWEWVRRYMENKNAPAELAPKLDQVLDIIDKKQGYVESFKTICSALLERIPVSVIVRLYPFIALEAAGRWFAMRTNKCPQWPKEIEDQCVIDPVDPYVIDAKTLKNSKACKPTL